MDIYLVLKMLGDKSRLRIVNLLYDNILSVGEIQTILNLSQANTSKHLIKLTQNNIVLKKQINNTVYCYINDQYKNDCLVLNPILEMFSMHEDSKSDFMKLEQTVTKLTIEERKNLI